MSQNIEIEFKNMLTEEEFNFLLVHFKKKATDFITQVNYYFDTKDFALKQLGCALRIRKKNGHFEMTLKEPYPNGLLETTEDLSLEQANNLLEGNPLHKGIIMSQLIGKQVDIEHIHLFGALTTDRIEFPYHDGMLVLDVSSYLNKIDFELEYEVSDFTTGQAVFLKLLETLHIPVRKTENKVKRFYEVLKRSNQ